MQSNWTPVVTIIHVHCHLWWDWSLRCKYNFFSFTGWLIKYVNNTNHKDSMGSIFNSLLKSFYTSVITSKRHQTDDNFAIRGTILFLRRNVDLVSMSSVWPGQRQPRTVKEEPLFWHWISHSGIPPPKYFQVLTSKACLAFYRRQAPDRLLNVLGRENW